MTDHEQAAIEAAAKQHSPHLWDWRFRDSLLLLRGFTPEIADEAVEKRRAEILAEAQEYIVAAEPHLRKKWAEELERAMFKVESVHHFGFGEGGIKCLCGFESARNRSRTEHITQAVRDLVEGGGND